jgi:hypothetical protein
MRGSGLRMTPHRGTGVILRCSLHLAASLEGWGNQRMRPSFETREDALLKVTGRMHGHTRTIQRAAKRGVVVILNPIRFANFNH